MSSEIKRKAVHISMVVFALAIGRLPPWMIVACCGTAFFFNLLVLPVISKRGLERDADLKRGFSLGMLMYPAVLFFLSLIFYQQQIFLALGWGALAFGDGFAGLTGRSLKGPKISWNRDKSWSGTLLGFMLIGSCLTFGLIQLLPESARLGLSPMRWALIVAISVSLAALAETVKGSIDDNLIVPLTAAFCGWMVAGIHQVPALPANLMTGLFLVLLLMVLSIAFRKIDVAGGLVGGVLAWSIFLGGGLGSLALLFAFFVLGSLASKWRILEKDKLGLAQEDKGKRSVRHAISNGGIAAVAGLLAWFYPQAQVLFLGMLAAALASATADTLASEMGNVYGKRFINILSLKEDSRGLDGVISLEGSLFGAAGSMIIALMYHYATGTMLLSLFVACAGIFGNVLDSVLGASLQRRGYMTNDSVNFANTLASALFFYLLYLVGGSW